MPKPSAKPAARKSSPYSPHPSLKMADAYKSKLLASTGRSYDDWIESARRTGPSDVAARKAWLRKRHGLGANYAHWIAEGTDWSAAAYEPEKLVAAQYEGGKSALRPIYERLLALGFELGEDVKACPCRTKVPLYRNYVFAEIKPTTTRIDFGLALGTTPASGKLQSLKSRAAGDRITHKIGVSSLDEIDGELRRWLKLAYENGAVQRDRDRGPAVAAAIPADLKKTLAASKTAQATWAGLTERMRADWIEWITSAAKAETRAKRIGVAGERLAKGLKRAY